MPPPFSRDQNKLEKDIAEKVKKNLNSRKTFVVLGDIHASKNPLSIKSLKINPTGSILYDELKESLFSIRIAPRSGEFFNFGTKKVGKSIYNEDFNKNFDYVYFLDKITLCSFLNEKIS